MISLRQQNAYLKKLPIRQERKKRMLSGPKWGTKYRLVGKEHKETILEKGDLPYTHSKQPSCKLSSSKFAWYS